MCKNIFHKILLSAPLTPNPILPPLLSRKEPTRPKTQESALHSSISLSQPLTERKTRGEVRRNGKLEACVGSAHRSQISAPPLKRQSSMASSKALSDMYVEWEKKNESAAAHVSLIACEDGVVKLILGSGIL